MRWAFFVVFLKKKTVLKFLFNLTFFGCIYIYVSFPLGLPALNFEVGVKLDTITFY